MPIPISVPIRRQIVERHQSGIKLSQIALDLEMPYESVRNVWRLYRKEGRVEPNYGNCGQKIKGSRRVYRGALYLNRLHPGWGAGLIRQVMAEKWLEEKIPTARSLQRWFKQAQIGGVPKKGLGEARIGRGREAHHIWEMDSREGIELGTGKK